ncbi:MAG: glycosyltransferase family 4 protein [Thermoplasmata archaeon]|nr:MAG: glycosyltransferase family 4 protein [Thermoplasmata archaeon]
MAEKLRVLLIYPHLSSFIERDLDILSGQFEVVPFEYRGKKDLFGLMKNILSADVNISWFSLGHATTATSLSKFFKKNSVVVAGGWDVVAMPEIGYGAMLDNRRIRKTRYALKNAGKILAVSESTKQWVRKWVDRDDIILLYHGFDSERFAPKGAKEDMVLTVGTLKNEVTIRVKGLKTYVEAARLLPDVRFVLVGKHEPEILKTWWGRAPSNLEILDFLPTEELIGLYQKSKVYAQLSYQESFGCALAEAMLCECVPVVTKRGAIPEVVGDTGLYVEYGDAEDTTSKIKEAMASDKGSAARKRVTKLFPIEDRRQRLTKIIDDCLK